MDSDSEKTLIYFVDASCWPNPNGNIKTGLLCYEAFDLMLANKNTRTISSASESTKFLYHKKGFYKFGTQHFGRTSNNMGEHIAIGNALLEFYKSNEDKCVIFSDSEMSVKQLNGLYGISRGKVYTFNALENVKMLKELSKDGKDVEIIWIPRELNSLADELTK